MRRDCVTIVEMAYLFLSCHFERSEKSRSHAFARDDNLLSRSLRHSLKARNTASGAEDRLVLLGRLKDFREPSAQPCIPLRQQIELGGVVGIF